MSRDETAGTLARSGIAVSMLNNARVTQLTLESYVAYALALLACTVVKTVVTTIFHLTSFSCPITNASTCTIHATSMTLCLMTLARALGRATVRSSPSSKTLDTVIIMEHALAWADVLALA